MGDKLSSLERDGRDYSAYRFDDEANVGSDQVRDRPLVDGQGERAEQNPEVVVLTKSELQAMINMAANQKVSSGVATQIHNGMTAINTEKTQATKRWNLAKTERIYPWVNKSTSAGFIDWDEVGAQIRNAGIVGTLTSVVSMAVKKGWMAWAGGLLFGSLGLIYAGGKLMYFGLENKRVTGDEARTLVQEIEKIEEPLLYGELLQMLTELHLEHVKVGENSVKVTLDGEAGSVIREKMDDLKSKLAPR